MGNEDQLLYDTLLVIKIISHNLQFAYIYVYIYTFIYIYMRDRGGSLKTFLAIHFIVGCSKYGEDLFLLHSNFSL